MKKSPPCSIQSVYRMFLMLIVLYSAGLNAQTDTVHLYYHPMHSAPHDTTDAKIDAWVKSLNGHKVDLQVVAYYHRSEFKKAAEARADELFLVLNRKARSLINITFIGPKKGKNFQRTTVDLIYTAPESAGKTKAATTMEKEGKEKQEPEKTENKRSENEKEGEKTREKKTEQQNTGEKKDSLNTKADDKRD